MQRDRGKIEELQSDTSGEEFRSGPDQSGAV